MNHCRKEQGKNDFVEMLTSNLMEQPLSRWKACRERMGGIQGQGETGDFTRMRSKYAYAGARPIIRGLVLHAKTLTK